ncbi:MAG: VOC family protein [Chloroflexota bacterium]
MKEVIPYLMFSGSCHEALNFYKSCLNGEIVSLQTVGDSPLDVPAEFQDRIFDSEFRAEGVRFKASDDMPGQEVVKGGNFAMFVTFSDQQEQKRVFDELSNGGQVQFPLENNFGMLIDKYQVQWMLAG